jgi:hypothetical protein
MAHGLLHCSDGSGSSFAASPEIWTPKPAIILDSLSGARARLTRLGNDRLKLFQNDAVEFIGSPHRPAPDDSEPESMRPIFRRHGRSSSSSSSLGAWLGWTLGVVENPISMCRYLPMCA